MRFTALVLANAGRSDDYDVSGGGTADPTSGTAAKEVGSRRAHVAQNLDHMQEDEGKTFPQPERVGGTA
jgi:hypothetical protein